MADKLFELEAKIALVTGSSGGLGKTLAEGLARNGVKVIINGRNHEKITKVIEEFQEKGYDVFSAPFDVTDSKEIEKAVEVILKEVGLPDIIVNNAGIQRRHALEDFPEQDWDDLLETNLKSAFLVSKAFIKDMIKRKSGKIINIGSMQSELGRPTVTPYAAAKGGIKMLTRGMATEWAKYGIQINGIGPGYFKTELTQALYENPEFDHWLRARTPAERWGDPAELVGSLLFLSSEASAFVNGQMLYVDGGITACI